MRRRLPFHPFGLVLLTGAVLGFAVRAAAVSERRLPNLSEQGSLADPLPGLRGNRPTAAEIAGRVAGHPSLFFDRKGRDELRGRLNTTPYRELLARLLAQADRAATQAIPPQAVMRDELPMFLPNGSFNPEYAREEYGNVFFKQSYLLRDVLPPLGLAYQLTGDARYGAAGKRWLLEFAARPKFAPMGREADFHLAQVVYSLALGYDWLWELLDDSERQQVRSKLAALSEPLHRSARMLLELPDPQAFRGALGGNHVRRTQGLFAVAPLVLLAEVPAAKEWLDVQIQLHRDRLYPSAFAPNGEHLDMWDHFNTSVDDPMAFTVALQRMGGEDLLADPALAPRFRGLPAYALFGLEEWFRDGTPNRHGWNGPGENDMTAGWLAIASRLKDPAAQWLAMRDNGLARLDPVAAILYYDPAVKPVMPAPPRGSVYFPYSGFVRLATGWGRDDLLISLRCGPRIPKDFGDQNALRLRFADEWLMPGPAQIGRRPDQTDEFNYDLMAWFRGSPGQSLVLPLPGAVDDYRQFQQTGRIRAQGGIQWAVYSIMDDSFSEGSERPDIPHERRWFRPRPELSEWLSGPETEKTGDLKAVQFSDEVDYLCGDVRRAYHFIEAESSQRQVVLVKEAQPGSTYAIVCDEFVPKAGPVATAWQVHAGAAATVGARGLGIEGRKGALNVQWLNAGPADRIVRKETPAPLEAERTAFFQFTPDRPRDRSVYLVALLPGQAGEKAAVPVIRELPAKGGWAVEVLTPTSRDLILFRAKGASEVRVGDTATSQAAGVLRQPVAGGEPVFYPLGRPAP